MFELPNLVTTEASFIRRAFVSTAWPEHMELVQWVYRSRSQTGLHPPHTPWLREGSRAVMGTAACK